MLELFAWHPEADVFWLGFYLKTFMKPIAQLSTARSLEDHRLLLADGLDWPLAPGADRMVDYKEEHFPLV